MAQIDPSIPLGVRPVQVHDPLEQFSKVQGIRNMIQLGRDREVETQYRQEEVKKQQISNAKATRDAQDQEIVRNAYVKANGVPEDTIKAAIQGGAGPGAVQDLQKHFGDLAEHAAKTASDKLAVDKTKNDQFLALHDSALDMIHTDPNQFNQAWPQFYQRISEIEPEAAKRLDPATPPSAGDIQVSRALHQTLDYNLKSEEQKRAATKAAQDAAEADRKAKLFPSQMKEAENKALTTTPNEAGLTAEQQATQDRAKTTAAEVDKRATATAAETARHNLVTEATAREGHQLQAKKFTMEFGGDAVKGWAATLAQNPDAAGSVPQALRSNVEQEFMKQTGLPYPKPLSAATQSQETAARNALDGVAFIEKALENPEIRANIGPIMGRLGNLEQSIGTAPHLSAEATQLAQELRTRMRYFVFQEGKSIFGGRVPQQLMNQLEESSASVKMDPDMLRGALKGASENAKSVMDNADAQRFGGKKRSREARGIETAATTPTLPAVLSTSDVGKIYKSPKTGKNMKITKVDPANGKNFLSEDVP